MDIIRYQEQDLKFSNQVVNNMLKDSDQYKIRQKSSWDENTKTWYIPNFIIGEKKTNVAFPTINGKSRVE
jgi:hypothetical protein